MLVVTANIGRGASGPRVARNLRRIRRALRRLRQMATAVVFFQEIDEDDAPNEHALVRRVFRRFRLGAGRTRVPIAVGLKWRIVEQRITHAADGYGGVTPSRVVVDLVIKHRLRRRLPPIALVGAHYPYPNPRHTAQQQRAARARWDQVLEVVRERVAARAGQGLTVLVGADTNERDMPKVHERERRIVAGGIDRLSVVPGSVNVRVKRTGRIALDIDGHDARWALLRLRAKRAA